MTGVSHGRITCHYTWNDIKSPPWCQSFRNLLLYTVRFYSFCCDIIEWIIAEAVCAARWHMYSFAKHQKEELEPEVLCDNFSFGFILSKVLYFVYIQISFIYLEIQEIVFGQQYLIPMFVVCFDLAKRIIFYSYNSLLHLNCTNYYSIFFAFVSCLFCSMQFLKKREKSLFNLSIYNR